MIEPIGRALLIAGEELDFDGDIVLGLPGFSVTTLYKGEQSLYEVETQMFKFQMSMEDVVENHIVQDSLFTMMDTVYRYLFKVDRYTPDLTGWAEVSANYISRELI